MKRINYYINKFNKIIIEILVISVLIFLVSCSSWQSYNFWSTFLDDVPPPDSTGFNNNNIKDSLNITSKDTVKEKTEKIELVEYTHPPAEEGSCNNCHNNDKSFVLNEKLPTLCYGCHDDFKKKFKVLHGPINTGSCTACHDPHKSVYKPLLHRDGQDLCYYCHDKNAVLKNDIHSSIADSKCWDCHNPHGGSDMTFMK